MPVTDSNLRTGYNSKNNHANKTEITAGFM